jgi:N-acetylneuraminic acid mutarotase
LSFEDRVRAQEAIERVYYSHQIGVSEPFEKTVPRRVLEDKVRRYLKQSVALEELWKTPITAEMLRREVQRMARETRLPGRLGELYAALGHDPFLIEECLARATLADRLSRNFFAYNQVIHDEARRQAEILHHELETGGIDLQTVRTGQQIMGATVDEVFLVEAQDAGGGQPRAEKLPDDVRVRRLELSPEEYRRRRDRFPERVGTISPVTQERESFTIRAVLSETEDEVEVVVLSVAKTTWEDWWDQAAFGLDGDAVEPASNGVASLPSLEDRPVETRTPAGINLSETLDDVSAETCPDGVWDNGILDDWPEGHSGHTAVWTGSVMIVWGGAAARRDIVDTGGHYDPAIDSWTPISTAGAPSFRREHTALWTGDEMIVWGGEELLLDPNGALVPSPLDSGGRYDPANDTWAPISLTNAPSARVDHTAVWTGSEMIVWGGSAGWPDYDLNTGGRYDPVADTWTPTSTTGAPQARYEHTAVWTGSRMVVWGGWYPYLATGGRYDPLTDTWTPTSTTGAPLARTDHTAVWTGEEMIVWGGRGSSVSYLDSGGRYDPLADSWSPTSTTGAPPVRRSDINSVWTGSEMIIWGGEDINRIKLNTGSRYDPATDTWTPTSTTGAPVARTGHTTVWTGDLMIAWGGNYGYELSGGRYDPDTDTWTPTFTTGAPSPRHSHTAAWTGSHMIVWGGLAGATYTYHDTGGLYNPATDTWTPTSTTGAPSGRHRHTAVWTGEEMVVWGGHGVAYPHHLDTGGRYDPVTDTWTPTSTTGAPIRRSGHTTVWTGDHMIVWGGYGIIGGGGYLVDTGGRYEPATDTWTPTSTTDAPQGRLNRVLKNPS